MLLKIFFIFFYTKILSTKFFATTAVVPVPKKGSNIESPLFVVANIILCNKASGFCVE